VFTSGTTGEPVGHPKSFGALVCRARAMSGLFLPKGTGIVGTVPPQHMYGFETTITLPLHAPVAVSCADAFYHADIAQALGELPAPRILVTTPMQLRLLLDAEAGLPALIRIVSATAPLPQQLAAAAEAHLATEVHEIYGATEVGSVARRRTLDGDLWENFPGIGFREHADGVEVTAPHAVPTPLNDEIAPEGAGFRLLGRRTDMVKLAGKRASLAGLTRILTGIDGVHDGLFVAPDDLEERPSARLLAYVVAPGRSSADIMADLRRLVEPAFLPRRVVCVDGLPRNAIGKLTRHAIDAMVAREAPCED
jgi:acyl-coenzyme A synthetase/AMP-(fatty) acid ligase